MTARTGCSSWTSPAWSGRFYPPGIRDGDRLAYYARYFDTVEVDSTYYRDPGPGLFRRWASVTPPGFTFALKFPRDLLDPKEPLDRDGIGKFLDNARLLGSKLGPVLLQFPPWFRPGRATQFLLDIVNARDLRIRYAVELRDGAWYSGEPFRELRQALSSREIALAWSYLTYLEIPPVLTTDFVYLRFIGDHDSIPEDQHGEIRVDRAPAMRSWGERFREALRDNVQEGFAFFNNHFEGYGPGSVRRFREATGLPP